jgi:hypothetical protein
MKYCNIEDCPKEVNCVLFTVGVLRYWLRLVWDAATFHMLIKKRGRVPASDSFVVKRVAGPGLASNYFYQVSVSPVSFCCVYRIYSCITHSFFFPKIIHS